MLPYLDELDQLHQELAGLAYEKTTATAIVFLIFLNQQPQTSFSKSIFFQYLNTTYQV